jgi:uncharacterized protein YdhG (YjbR/CyaY superfamily)
MSRATAGSVDQYIAGFPPETRKLLEELRALDKTTAHEVTERISYGIPTFDLDGRYLVYIAGFKKHVSLYPVTADVTEALGADVEPYKKGKGTVQFPLGQPLPTGLIRRIVELRVEERRARTRQ